MKVIKIVLLQLLPALLLASCTPSALTPRAYIDHFNNQSRAIKVDASKISYEFSVYPAEYVALKEVTSSGSLDKEQYHKRLKEIAGYLFVHIKLVNNRSGQSVIQGNAASADDIDSRTQYYSFHAGDDIYAVCGHDTERAADYRFEENYNISNYAMINAVFRRCDADRLTIHFNDRAYNNHNLTASVPLHSFPQLKID